MNATLTLLGTGTSHGVPEIGCGCKVCKSLNPRDKRLRSSAWLHSNDISILIDCSADFREQALKHSIHRVDAILITHTHRDHVGGLDDIRSLNTTSGRIPIYILQSEVERLHKSFYYLFDALPQEGGGIPEVAVMELFQAERFKVNQIIVQPLMAYHGVLTILGFRIGNMAYLTDVKSLPISTIEAIQGVDTLVINALRERPHRTHMNLAESLNIIERIGPKQAYLIHTTHDLGYEETNKKLPTNIQLGYDGLDLAVTL